MLVTPYDYINGGYYEDLSLGIATSLFSLLARVTLSLILTMETVDLLLHG